MSLQGDLSSIRPFRKYKCYITLAVLKQGSSCCAVNGLLHSNLKPHFQTAYVTQHFYCFNGLLHVLVQFEINSPR